MKLLFKASYGFYNPETFKYDVKRVLKAMNIEIEEERALDKNSWRIKGKHGSFNVLVLLKCEYLESKDIPAFKHSYVARMYYDKIPYCDIELYSDGEDEFNEKLKRRMELGLFRAGGV